MWLLLTPPILKSFKNELLLVSSAMGWLRFNDGTQHKFARCHLVCFSRSLSAILIGQRGDNLIGEVCSYTIYKMDNGKTAELSSSMIWRQFITTWQYRKNYRPGLPTRIACQVEAAFPFSGFSIVSGIHLHWSGRAGRWCRFTIHKGKILWIRTKKLLPGDKSVKGVQNNPRQTYRNQVKAVKIL